MPQELKERPIFSTRADDPELGDAIDGFVVGLAERVDHLQDAEARRDFDQLASLAQRLADDAERLGFSYLASCAAVIDGAGLEQDREAAHKSVVEITQIARRVRLGHRGSA
jgi:hypothetical protein